MIGSQNPIQRFLSKFVFDVLPAALASVIGGFLFSQYHAVPPHAPKPPIEAAVSTEQMQEAMAMVRDEHSLIVDFLKTQQTNAEKTAEKEDAARARALDEARMKVAAAAREEAEPRPAVKRRFAEAPAAKPARPSGSKPEVVAASEPLNIIPAAASESEPPEKPLGPIDRVVARAEALKDKAMSKLAAIPLWIATTGGKLIGVETNSSSAPATRLMSASW